MKRAYLTIKELKDNDESMTFEAYASTDVVDRYGDVVTMEALKSVANKTTSIPMLYGHSTNKDDVMGRFDIIGVDEKGLKLKGNFLKGDKDAKRVYELLKMNAINKLSIGFIPLKEKENDTGGYTISDIDLVETSIVPIPANPDAEITSVKRLKGGNMDKKEITDDQVTEMMSAINDINAKLDTLIAAAGTTAQNDQEIEDEKELKAFAEVFKKGE